MLFTQVNITFYSIRQVLTLTVHKALYSQHAPVLDLVLYAPMGVGRIFSRGGHYREFFKIFPGGC